MTGRGRPPIGPATTIRLEPELKRALEAEAERAPQLTLAALIRYILHDWLDWED